MISVIMSTYNEPAEYIMQAVDSILGQTFSDIEFIVVIDGPTNTAAVELLETYKAKDSRIKIVMHEVNKGLVRSLNDALKLASGEYVARMDADDVSFPDRLEKQLEYIEKHGCDIVAARTIYIDENGVRTGGESLYIPPQRVGRALRITSYLPHPTWLVRRNVYADLGAYRDIDSCEDYDFLLRALRSGYRIEQMNEVLLSYRINSRGISQSKSYKQILTTKYLTDNYKNIQTLDSESIRRYVEDNSTEEKMRRFYDAEKHMAAALDARRRPLRFTAEFTKAVSLSDVYRSKLIRFLRCRKL